MKQFSLTTIPLLCAAIAPLCADNVDNMISQNNNGNSYNSSNNQRMKDSQRQFEQRWRDNQITPVANPKPDGSFNPLITADFIYWKTYQEGMSFAWTGAPLAPSVVPPSATPGDYLRPKFKWEPGFKVGLGNKFAHDGWDLYAQYTWLHPAGNESDDGCCDEDIVAWSNYWLPTNTGPEAVLMSSESARWKLHFNALDLELGRNFYISKFLTLRPFAGLKFSWLKQHYNVNYNGLLYVQDQSDIPSSNVVLPVGSDVHLKFKQNQFGAGLRFGMNTHWYFCKYLGAYGDFAVSAMWNRFKERRKDEVSTILDTEYNSFQLKDKIHDVTAVIELGLGLFFEWDFCNEAYSFCLAAGWENQVWFNQNQFVYLENTNAPGNLSMQGFTLKAGFGF